MTSSDVTTTDRKFKKAFYPAAATARLWPACASGRCSLAARAARTTLSSLAATDQGLKPRFLKGEPPSDADMAHVVQKISRRVIRKLRHLGYLEAGMDVPVATGYDPLRDTEPKLARTMAASVKQRIAFGERAGQKVRRIGSGFGYEGERPELTGSRCASVNGFSLHAHTAIPAHRRDQLERLIRYTARGAVSEDANGDLIYTFNRPWSDATTGIKLSPLELLEKLAALVPLPRVHLACYAGCLAPHSKLRDAIIPTPRQQGVDGEEKKTGNTVLELGQTAGSRVRSEYGHLSVLPPWRTTHHRCHHPGVGDYPHPASPQAGFCPTSHCVCPLSPRALRVRRGPRQRGPIGDVRAAAVCFAPSRL